MRTLQQLRALPVVGRIWERDVLPLRVPDYDPAELDALCNSGELVWIGSGGSDPRRGRVRFLFRGEGNVYLSTDLTDFNGENESVPSVEAKNIYDFLKSEGAVFFADIGEALEMDDKAVESALIELVMAGLVTNDSLEAMRKLVEEGAPQSGERQSTSSFEADLAQRRAELGLGQRQFGHKPATARYRSARQRARQHVEQVMTPRWVGRWTPVHRFGIMGKAVTVGERTARQARQLLSRYGVVTHECLADEVGSWDWSLLYQEYQRLEMRGEIRRGYFVQGLSGVQFALPDAVERLRALRDSIGDDVAPVVLNACDPANLYGPARADGPTTIQGEPLTFARVPTTWLVQHRGLPVLVASNGGAHLVTAQGADDGTLQRALAALFAHLARTEHRIVVETWNGEPVLDSPGQSLLEAVGGYRYYPGMAWERRGAQ